MADDDVNPLDTPSMRDWLKCFETAVTVVREMFMEVPGSTPDLADRLARAVFARLGAHEPSIAITWNREEKTVEDLLLPTSILKVGLEDGDGTVYWIDMPGPDGAAISAHGDTITVTI